MNSAHRNIFQTSDFIVFAGVLLGLIVEIFIPSSFSVFLSIRLMLGLVLFLVATIFILKGKREFKKFAQKSEPGKETTKLVSTGIFQFSRNSMYLGMVFLAISVSLFLDSLWLLLSSVFCLFCNLALSRYSRRKIFVR
jgi:protein-S-isoprenylcysteine O-methyltransferase Ste14